MVLTGQVVCVCVCVSTLIELHVEHKYSAEPRTVFLI